MKQGLFIIFFATIFVCADDQNESESNTVNSAQSKNTYLIQLKYHDDFYLSFIHAARTIVREVLVGAKLANPEDLLTYSDNNTYNIFYWRNVPTVYESYTIDFLKKVLFGSLLNPQKFQCCVEPKFVFSEEDGSSIIFTFAEHAALISLYRYLKGRISQEQKTFKNMHHITLGDSQFNEEFEFNPTITIATLDLAKLSHVLVTQPSHKDSENSSSNTIKKIKTTILNTLNQYFGHSIGICFSDLTLIELPNNKKIASFEL